MPRKASEHFWKSVPRNGKGSDVDKVVISCALSGVAANRAQCPGIPYTPAEYGEESKRAAEAGASIVHIHARKPDGTPTQDVEDYLAIRDAILARVPEMIINFSTGA